MRPRAIARAMSLAVDASSADALHLGRRLHVLAHRVHTPPDGWIPEAATAFWHALKQAEQHVDSISEAETAGEATRLLHQTLLSPPSCARPMCLSPPSVQPCLSAEPLRGSWPVEVAPWLAQVKGPAALLPLPASQAHLMVRMRQNTRRRRRQNTGGGCWIFPAEYGSPRLSTEVHLSGISAALRAGSTTAALRPTVASSSCNPLEGSCATSIVVGRPDVAASVLHVIGTRNFFHFVRDGFASLLLLSSATHVAVRNASVLLVPDETLWHEHWDSIEAAMEPPSTCSAMLNH